jgi:hypothetical protein
MDQSLSKDGDRNVGISESVADAPTVTHTQQHRQVSNSREDPHTYSMNINTETFRKHPWSQGGIPLILEFSISHFWSGRGVSLECFHRSDYVLGRACGLVHIRSAGFVVSWYLEKHSIILRLADLRRAGDQDEVNMKSQHVNNIGTVNDNIDVILVGVLTLLNCGMRRVFGMGMSLHK